MKLLIFLSMMATSVFARTYLVDQISNVSGLDANFILEHHQQPDHFINLDCQSFFKKFDFYEDDQLIFENFLTMGECEYLYKETIQCFDSGKQKCFNPERVFEPGCNCSL